MSFDIFLQRFENGDAADADANVILATLDPFLRRVESAFGQIVTADGEADIYGLDSAESGLMLNHASGRHIWDLIWTVANNAGLVIMPGDAPACVTDSALAEHLPEPLRPGLVVRSGGQLLDVAEAG